MPTNRSSSCARSSHGSKRSAILASPQDRHRRGAHRSMPTEVWLPLATLFVGYGLSLLTEWVRDSRARARDTETRRVTRDELRGDRRDDFQRETLLRLQDALFDLSRSVGAIHVEDRTRFKA